MTSNDLQNENVLTIALFMSKESLEPSEYSGSNKSSVIRRSNTGFVAATVFSGFLAFV